jgi:peroxiredoxin
MRAIRAWLAYGVVVGLAAALGWRFFSELGPAARRERAGACMALQGIEDGRPAPAFALEDDKGKTHRLSDYAGNLVLLNFWATWCPPCVEEAPSLEALARAVDGLGVATLAISVDDDWNAIRRFVADGGFGTASPRLTVLLDAPRSVAGALGTTKFPETYLVDRGGKVVYRFVNQRDWSGADAQACIRSLL